MFTMFVLAVCFLLFVVVATLTEVEKFGWATLTMILTLVGVQLFNVFDVWSFVTHHTVESLVYLAGYLGVGVLWSFAKWFSFLMNFRDEWREAKAKFLDGKRLPA